MTRENLDVVSDKHSSTCIYVICSGDASWFQRNNNISAEIERSYVTINALIWKTSLDLY
jgi:hypothetical protein